MKIMVTGGMGFVGSHLCESLLKENHNLIILTKSFKKKSNILGGSFLVSGFNGFSSGIPSKKSENPFSSDCPEE